jgi:hypothetical protein
MSGIFFPIPPMTNWEQAALGNKAVVAVSESRRQDSERSNNKSFRFIYG